jgi:hypothetical protein
MTTSVQYSPRTGQGRVGLWDCHPMSLDHRGAVLKCLSGPQSGFQTDSHSENQLIDLHLRIGVRIRPQVLIVQYSPRTSYENRFKFIHIYIF